MRSLLGAIAAAAEDVAVADMEAGLEHLSRGTPRHAETVVAVLEPYYRSLETGARVAELARELEVGRVLAVANKVATDADREAIRSFCEKRELPLAAELPHDEAVLAADRAGAALLDHAPDAPIVASLRGLAGELLQA